MKSKIRQIQKLIIDKRYKEALEIIKQLNVENISSEELSRALKGKHYNMAKIQ